MNSTLRRTWAEIDLDALAHNYHALRKQMGPNSRFLGVVKADAYGHGSIQVARTLEELTQVYGLTRRETEILGLVFQDRNNEEILEQLHISKNTLLKHLQNLYRKCGVSSRWDLLKLR